MYVFAPAALTLPNELGRYFYKQLSPLNTHGTYLLDLAISNAEEVPEEIRVEQGEECASGRMVHRMVRLYFYSDAFTGGFAASTEDLRARYKVVTRDENGCLKDLSFIAAPFLARMTNNLVCGFLDQLMEGRLALVEEVPHPTWVERHQEHMRVCSEYGFVFDPSFVSMEFERPV